jgi:hypothetical protein
MNQDFNSAITSIINAAVYSKINEYMADYANSIGANINQINARLDQLEQQLRAENQAQGSTPMGKILQQKLVTDALGSDMSVLQDMMAQLQRQMDELKAREIYRPDHFMARLSYMEGAINNMHNTASINQMIEDQINESQQKVEDMLEEKFEEFGIDEKLKELLEESINDGTISITFTR